MQYSIYTMAYKRRMLRKVRRAAPKRRRLNTMNHVSNFAKGLLGAPFSSEYNVKGQMKKTSKYKTRPDRKMPMMSINPDYKEQKHQSVVDYLFTKKRFGKRPSSAKRAKKLVVTDQRLDRYAIRNYNAWGAGNGANVLQSVQNGATGTTVESPIHLFDVTAVPQSTFDGTVVYPTSHFVCTFSNETDLGNVVWRSYDGTGALTALSNDDQSLSIQNKERAWYLVDSDGHGQYTTSVAQNNLQFPGSHSLLESFNANLLFYSCRSHCTKFEVALIQLTEDVSPFEITERATAVWQAMHKAWGYNPIETGNNRLVGKNIKFLKRMTFMIDSPNGTGDADAASRIRQVNFGGYLNRKCNYNWGKQTDRLAIGAEDTFENGNANIGYSTHVHPKARVYMMIRALVPYRTGGTAGVPDYNTAASYDIHLTTTHRNLVTS